MREGGNQSSQVRSRLAEAWPWEDRGHLRRDYSFIHLPFIHSINVYALSIHWGLWPRVRAKEATPQEPEDFREEGSARQHEIQLRRLSRKWMDNSQMEPKVDIQ